MSNFEQIKLTDAEILSQFRDFMTRQKQGPDKFEPLKNHPLHRGVQDLNYVRPAPSEYPRMMHHASGLTKVVDSKDEQEALGPAWFTSPQVRKSDWKAKANEVHTKSGFQVYSHHVTFLQQSGIAGIETLKDAAEFLDKLNGEEQEQFFREAEEAAEPVAVGTPKKKK